MTSLASCGYLIEFALAVLVWVLTRQDLHRMDAGLMDPEGREPIHCARQATFVGVVFSSFGLAVICLMVCADWAVLRR